MKRTRFAILLGMIAILSACSPSEEKRLSKAPASVTEIPAAKEIGKPLIQRYMTGSSDHKVRGNLCLISEYAVTVVLSEYNTKTAKNRVKTYQKFISIPAQALTESIAEVIEAPQVFDDKTRSDKGSASIYLFDPKENDHSRFHVLFNHNSSGLEKKDSPLAATLIATTNELCADALPLKKF